MTRPDPASLAFEDVLIDFAGRRLLRAGEPQALEPKAFAVLALLASEPGRVFTRDEILDAVWGHRHVTPGVLNRIVTLLRQALGEDAQHARRLQTLHGIGYRFDLPTPPAATSVLEPPNPAPAPVASPPPDIGAHPASGSPPQPRARVIGLLAALGLLLAVLLLRDAPMAPPAVGGETEQAQTSAVPTLVVMPLTPIGGDDGARLVAEGLSEELICSLARIDGLRVIAHGSTRLAAAQSPAAPDLVRQLGITHSLEGNLQQSGQALRVRMRLVDAADGHTVWVQDFDRQASEILVLQREVAQQVADSLALEMGFPPEPGSRSGDAEALRRDFAARALLARWDLPPEASAVRAEAEFRQMVQEGPRDVRAHVGLALALTVRAMREPANARTLAADMQRAAAALRQLDPTRTESYAVEAQAACILHAWDTCLALKQRAQRMSPSNTHVVLAYAITLVEAGYLDRAEQVLRELLPRDPLNPRVRYLLGRLLDAQGRHAEAATELAQAGARATLAQWFNAAWRGDLDAARRIAADVTATGVSSSIPALASMLEGASGALADASRWPRAQEEFGRSREGRALGAFVRGLVPDAPPLTRAERSEVIEHIATERHRGDPSWSLLLWSPAGAAILHSPEFRADLESSGLVALWRVQGIPTSCRERDATVDCGPAADAGESQVSEIGRVGP